MKIPEREELKAFEASVSDTLVTFTHDHAPVLRKMFAESLDADLVYITYCAFFGHTVDVIYRVMGRERVLEMVTQVMDRIDTVNATVVEGAKRGLALDPYEVASAVVNNEAS